MLIENTNPLPPPILAQPSDSETKPQVRELLGEKSVIFVALCVPDSLNKHSCECVCN